MARHPRLLRRAGRSTMGSGAGSHLISPHTLYLSPYSMTLKLAYQPTVLAMPSQEIGDGQTPALVEACWPRHQGQWCRAVDCHCLQCLTLTLWLDTMPSQEIGDGQAPALVEACWQRHQGQWCRGVNWERVPLQQLLEICRCGAGGVDAEMW